MMKFFRKYTKHLLAVFMALLLVVWLAGDPIANWLARGSDQMENVLRGTLGGKEIRHRDALPILQEIEVLDSPELQATLQRRDLPPWKMIWYSVPRQLGVSDRMGLYQSHMEVARARGYEPLSEDEWFLLLTEARRNGIFVPSEAVERFKAENGIVGPLLRRLREHFPLKVINSALQSYLMVQQQAAAACKAPPVSEADISQFVRRVCEQADVTVVTLAASSKDKDGKETSKFFDPSYTPSESELAALFDKHKNTASQPAGMSFGYQQPAAVQIEYLKIDAAALRDKQIVDEETAFEYWKRHTKEFPMPTSTQPAPGTTAPSPPEVKYYTTFAEAKKDVVGRLKKMKADEAAIRLAREIIENLREPWASSSSTQPAAEKEAPASQESLDVYTKALQEWSTKQPGVLSHVTLGMLEAPALAANSDIGRSAGYLGGPGGLRFQQAAFLVQGLEEEPDRQSEEYRYFRKLYETCVVPFTDENGNVYVFRPIAIRPAQAPASLDAVRERLIADARLEHAFKLAGEQAKALKERAASIGLEAAFAADAELRKFVDDTALSHPTPFTRERCFAMSGYPPHVSPNYVQALGSDPELLGAIFELAPPTTTQPVRVLTWEQAEQRRWLVVQLNRILPPTKDEYDKQRPNAIQYLRNQYQAQLLAQWFDPEQISKRLDWTPAEAAQQARKRATARR